MSMQKWYLLKLFLGIGGGGGVKEENGGGSEFKFDIL
jgi:hypothetical protein